MSGANFILHLESSGQTPGRRFIYSLDTTGTQRRMNYKTNTVEESKIDLAQFWADMGSKCSEVTTMTIPKEGYSIYTPVSFSPGYHFKVTDQKGQNKEFAIWGSISAGAKLNDGTSILPSVFSDLYSFMTGQKDAQKPAAQAKPSAKLPPN
eukprot:TRINITY_DN10978_c0_g1_i1.p1 TRINITY_DN10978_c0_g1~~TRINITY_DN10978_c0_g1_i1.p1  ORF type:complete len:151 (-),score=25.66 TRINITY_DN10978_c0_g1_i1:77-529(-)